MSLAKKLLNKSINFEENKNSVENIKTCLIGVISFDLIIVEYNDRNNRREITQEVLRLNANEFINFLKEAHSLETISVFDTGRSIKYTRLELLKEIAERKRAFFDNSDRRSFLDEIQSIPADRKKQKPRPKRKTNRDILEEKRVAEGDSKRSLVVRTGNDKRKEATQIRFL